MKEKILNPNIKVGDIFPNDRKQAKILYKKLCKTYHPDVYKSKDGDSLIYRINELYTKANELFDLGLWEKTNFIQFKTINGKKIQITYQYHCIFEIGEYYVCNSNIIYVFDFSKKIYYNKYIENIRKIKYADKKMKDFYKRLIPDVIAEHDTIDNKHLIVLKKTPDVYPLSCVISNFFKNDIPDVHLAWMISRLLNICAFLKYNNLVCNGISIDNLFVSLDFHSILLYGGWWYMTENNEKMISTSKQVYNMMTPKAKSNKISLFSTDIECVKSFGRKFIKDSTPFEFKNFLNSGTKEDTFKECQKWDNALLKSFGKRKFIKVEATKKQIYNL